MSYLKFKKGFLLIEVLLAVTILSLLVSFVVGAAIYGEQSTMLSGARARAAFLADEGLEAARNIRDAQFSNLTDGTYGLSKATNVWTFSGSSDTTDIFTRSLAISSVTSTKKQIASTVTWQQNQQRSGSISLTTFLTKWQSQRGGLIVYSDTTQANQNQYNAYNNATNAFNLRSPIAGATINGRNFIIRTSPIKNEAIVGFSNPTSPATLQILCYNGSTWSSEWSVTVGGTGTTRRFDIAYETNNGDVVVLYSTNVGTTNELAYRTKAGTKTCGTSNWISATTFDPIRTSGIVQWVKLASDRRSTSNLIAAIWADAASDLSAAIWNGSSWSNEPSAALEGSLEFASSAQDVDSFDVEYESVTGDAMVVWSSTGNNVTGLLKSRKCTASGVTGCTWDASTTTIPTVNCAGTNLDISANPNTDQIIMGAIDNGTAKRLCAAYWSGSAWTGFAAASLDTSAQSPLPGTKLVATGWGVSTVNRAIIAYNDSAAINIGFVMCIPGAPTTCVVQADQAPIPTFGNPQKWYDIQMDPFNKDTFILIVSDVNNDLFAKRMAMSTGTTPTFTWEDANGGTTVETFLGQATTQPFSFTYWRNP